MVFSSCERLFRKLRNRSFFRNFVFASFFVSLLFIFYQTLFILKLNEFNFSTLKRNKVSELAKSIVSNDSNYSKDLSSKINTVDVFTCKYSKETIPITDVNDDYCDCADGTDETETSACPNGKFKCHNIPTMIIRSHRVKDGICDCCDGSDEWEKPVPLVKLDYFWQKKLGVFLSPCPNVC